MKESIKTKLESMKKRTILKRLWMKNHPVSEEVAKIANENFKDLEKMVYEQINTMK
jgi:hypothetical protein